MNLKEQFLINNFHQYGGTTQSIQCSKQRDKNNPILFCYLVPIKKSQYKGWTKVAPSLKKIFHRTKIFSKCLLWIWLHLLTKSLIKIFIFCAADIQGEMSWKTANFTMVLMCAIKLEWCHN